MTSIPFIYKYQPKKLNDFEISDDFKQMIKTLLEMDNMNILFIGNSGSGKTTLIHSLFKEYYKDESLINDNNILFIKKLILFLVRYLYHQLSPHLSYQS